MSYNIQKLRCDMVVFLQQLSAVLKVFEMTLKNQKPDEKEVEKLFDNLYGLIDYFDEYAKTIDPTPERDVELEELDAQIEILVKKRRQHLKLKDVCFKGSELARLTPLNFINDMKNILQ